MSEMICTCRADGVRETEARRLRIFKRMGLDDMGDLTKAIILSLAFDFLAVGYLAADMWFGVTLRTPLVEKGLYIECDHPADGYAALWEELAEKFPQMVSVKLGTAPSATRVTERISEVLLANYTSADAIYRGHRAHAHKGDNDCPPCEDCSVFMSLYITTRRTLEEAWGSRDLDPAIDEAYEEP